MWCSTVMMRAMFLCVLIFLGQYVAIAGGSCTLSSCEGVDMYAGIKRDFDPWRQRGGIKRKGDRTAALLIILCMNGRFLARGCFMVYAPCF